MGAGQDPPLHLPSANRARAAKAQPDLGVDFGEQAGRGGEDDLQMGAQLVGGHDAVRLIRGRRRWRGWAPGPGWLTARRPWSWPRRTGQSLLPCAVRCVARAACPSRS
jgi:hypothetical protein